MVLATRSVKLILASGIFFGTLHFDSSVSQSHVTVLGMHSCSLHADVNHGLMAFASFCTICLDAFADASAAVLCTSELLLKRSLRNAVQGIIF